MADKLRKIHIINPCAGKGNKPYKIDNVDEYVTTSVGDAESFAYQTCLKEPAHIIVFGGDGTVNEVVNGIIKAGAGDTARLSVVPAGTGNDFARFIGNSETYDELVVDAMLCNDRYAINMVNIGFDCSVVIKTNNYKKKPFIGGSLAYILGVCNVLMHRMGQRLSVRVETEDGKIHNIDRELLFTCIANAQCCGGGFRAAPVADICDGIIDVMMVDRISRMLFISLVGDYRKGKHIDPVTMEPVKSFKKFMSYIRCRAVDISGMEHVCIDGEISECSSLHIEPVPHALRVIRLPADYPCQC